MATYVTRFEISDLGSDKTWDAGISENAAEIITEGVDDGTFTLGETVEQTFQGTLTYVGVDADGGFPVFENDSGDTFGYVGLGGDLTPYEGQSYTIVEESFTLCFMAGTMVTTLEGTKAVEELSINDTVVTSNGEVCKVKFVGIQTMDKFTIPTNRLPVCIRQDALAPNVPNKDLYVSSDHAMYVDGILAHAGALVNDISIKRVERSELEQSFIYYHVELEDHSLILADNAAAETFVDNVTRAKFHNYKEYVELYGENENENLTGELELPRAMSKRQLPKAIKERLEERALALFSDELSHTA